MKEMSLMMWEEVHIPSSHRKECKIMNVNNDTTPDNNCADISGKQPRKSKGMRLRKVNAELTVVET